VCVELPTSAQIIDIRMWGQYILCELYCVSRVRIWWQNLDTGETVNGGPVSFIQQHLFFFWNVC
jgi:hypothetical protein